MFKGKLRYLTDSDEWLLFDPHKGWTTAPDLEADRAAKIVFDQLKKEAAECWIDAPDSAIAKKLRTHVERTSKAHSQNAMIKKAKSEPGISARSSDFDCDPMLLGWLMACSILKQTSS